jgi:hypothetical protein
MRRVSNLGPRQTNYSIAVLVPEFASVDEW